MPCYEIGDWGLGFGGGGKLGTFPFSKYTHRVIETVDESVIARHSKSSPYKYGNKPGLFFLSFKFLFDSEHLNTVDD